MILTKDEKGYILSLIDSNTDDLSKLEGAISDDGWIYDIYDTANSIREKFKKDNDADILKVIFENNVDIRWVKICNSVKEYNDGLTVLNKKLLKKDFDLIKRWQSNNE